MLSGNCKYVWNDVYCLQRTCLLYTSVNAEIPQELQELEQEAFLQIISGEKPVDYFDTFVVEWYANGGKVLTERVQNAYESGKN